ALDAYDAKIDRSVFLGDRMVAEGVVRFANSCVTGDFQWNVSSTDKVTLDLQSATVGKLLNHKKSCWPKPGKLLLNGFVYDQIDDKADANPELELADVQLLWLHQQPRKRLFSSQPYEQLAVVLRKRGLPEQARKVMIEMNKDHGTLLNWRPAWLWSESAGWCFRPAIVAILSRLPTIKRMLMANGTSQSFIRNSAHFFTL